MLHLRRTGAPRRADITAFTRAGARRRLIAAAVGALIAAGAAAGIAWAPAALGVFPTEGDLAQAAGAAQDGKIALINAQSLNHAVAAADLPLSTASVSVDITQLQHGVAALRDAEQLSAERVSDLTADVILDTVLVQSETLQLQDALTQAQEAEQERLAAEKAAAEARKRAEALAAANTPQGAQATARRMAAERYGWGSGQFSCLSKLWHKESGWDYRAYNSGSGATGIPQALPGGKMASAGSDWRESAATQISWGLDYIRRAYGAPCSAWGHSQAVNWY